MSHPIGDAFKAMWDLTMIAIWILFPLALWKLIDIAVWLFQHIRIVIN